MLSDKKLEKISKILGKDTIDSLNAQSVAELKNSIYVAEASIKDAVDELEANPKFQEIKESLKAISEGMKEVKKRQKAITQYSLHLLEE